MKWLASLVSSGVGELARDIEEVFTTSDREKLEQYNAETRRIQAERADRAAAQRANVVAAAHPSIFVAGARPAILWVCALGSGYHFLLYPIFGPVLEEAAGIKLVALAWEELSVMMAQVLGLSAYRTYEKSKGVARENMTATKRPSWLQRQFE